MIKTLLYVLYCTLRKLKIYMNSIQGHLTRKGKEEAIRESISNCRMYEYLYVEENRSVGIVISKTAIRNLDRDVHISSS